MDESAPQGQISRVFAGGIKDTGHEFKNILTLHIFMIQRLEYTFVKMHFTAARGLDTFLN